MDLNEPIETLDLDETIYKSLIKERIQTIDELINSNLSEIEKIDGIGLYGTFEILKKIHRYVYLNFQKINFFDEITELNRNMSRIFEKISFQSMTLDNIGKLNGTIISSLDKRIPDLVSQTPLIEKLQITNHNFMKKMSELSDTINILSNHIFSVSEKEVLESEEEVPEKNSFRKRFRRLINK